MARLSFTRIADKDQYSIWIGLIYIFNLIVGTGALTLPSAFSKAGWLFSTLALLILALLSYVNATFVIETMACANAVRKWKRLNANPKDTDDSGGTTARLEQPSPQQKNGATAAESSEPLIGEASSENFYSLAKQVELGAMANLFFNNTGRVLFYACMCIYLFGDVCIYEVAVGKTIMGVVCSKLPTGYTKSSQWHDIRCFGSSPTDIGGFTRRSCYRVAMLLFVATIGSFAFFNVQKTKLLQLITSVMRWLAFLLMISIAVSILARKGAQGHPVAVDVTGTPFLFGACVYSFMCHHSLPALVAPIRGDRHLGLHLAYDFILIATFYILLAATGAFAFAHLHDLYTLDFVPERDDNIFMKIVQYYLTLFPVITLSTSFPIICITLRNNLMALCLDTTRMSTYSFFVRRLLFPIIVLVPPTIITFFVDDIGFLIQFTGSYAGTGIQYLIPTFLVYYARRHSNKIFSPVVINQYSSPFKGTVWCILVLVWSVLCIIMVSVHIIEKFNKS